MTVIKCLGVLGITKYVVFVLIVSNTKSRDGTRDDFTTERWIHRYLTPLLHNFTYKIIIHKLNVSVIELVKN